MKSVIVYDSRQETGTTRNFAEKLGNVLGLNVVSVQQAMAKKEFNAEYILCTYTAGVGEVPQTTKAFLQVHSKGIKGVIANGSSNFMSRGLYGLAGDRISKEYKCDLLRKIDLGGNVGDVEAVAPFCAMKLGIDNRKLDFSILRKISQYTEGKFTFVPMW